MKSYIFKAKCTHVVDGDTADFIIDAGFRMTTEQRLRFLGVNTPEMKAKNPHERERAQAAKEFVEDKILGKELHVQTHKSDAFGRYLANVFLEDGTSLNDLLIETGHAKKFM